MLMTHKNPAWSIAPCIAPMQSRVLQRKCSCGSNASNGGECEACKKKQPTLQRASTLQAAPDLAPPIVHEVLRSSGQPLDGTTRAFMEPRFGHDFSKVRVHTDARAAESALAVNANAYTVGSNIVFAQQPSSRDGAGGSLLAHELAHVVQQAGTSSNAAALRVGKTDSPSEREAGHVSHAVMSQRGQVRPALSSPPSLQRDAAPAQAPANHCIPMIPGGGSKAGKENTGDDMVAWQSIYQQALQGAAGNPQQANAQQKAEHACEVANRSIKIFNKHGDQVVCTLKDVSDQKQVTSVHMALGTDERGDWGSSFKSALQSTTANGTSTIKQVDDAADIADQAVLRAGHIDDSLWNKYMACKGGGPPQSPAPAPGPAPKAPGA